MKNEIGRAESRSIIDRSFFSRSLSDPNQNRDLIGSASHIYLKSVNLLLKNHSLIWHFENSLKQINFARF